MYNTLVEMSIALSLSCLGATFKCSIFPHVHNKWRVEIKYYFLIKIKYFFDLIRSTTYML